MSTTKVDLEQFERELSVAGDHRKGFDPRRGVAHLGTLWRDADYVAALEAELAVYEEHVPGLIARLRSFQRTKSPLGNIVNPLDTPGWLPEKRYEGLPMYPKGHCFAPGNTCVNHGACNLADGCVKAPVEK